MTPLNDKIINKKKIRKLNKYILFKNYYYNLILILLQGEM